MTMTERLQSLNTDGPTTDELIELQAGATSLAAVHADYSTDGTAPVWLTHAIEQLDREIKSRFKDQMSKRLQDLDDEIEALLSRDEKRTKLQAERDLLKARLTGKTTTVHN